MRRDPSQVHNFGARVLATGGINLHGPNPILLVRVGMVNSAGVAQWPPYSESDVTVRTRGVLPLTFPEVKYTDATDVRPHVFPLSCRTVAVLCISTRTTCSTV